MLVYNTTTKRVEYLVELDGNGGQPIIVNLDYMQDTAPTNPQEKQVWYDTANNEIYTYKNGQWVESDPSVGVWYKFGDKYYLWDGDSLEETDLNIYEKIENKTSNFDTQSLITYPNSKALYDALQSQLATLTTFENKTGTVLETGLTLGNSVLVFINGSLLEAGAEADYIINGSQIIFSIPLQLTDKVGVINGNLRAIDLSPYQLKLGAANVITTGEGNVVGSVTADSGTVTVTKTTIESSTDYNDLDNKPSINGVTLSGNKTADDLGLNAMATINFYDVNNWTLDVTKTILTLPNVVLGNSVFVFKNGVLIQGNSNDYSYTVSGNNSVITFVTALEDTDKVAVINGNLTGIDLTPYLTASDLVPYQQKAQIIEDSTATPGGNDGLAIQANKVYKFTNTNITSIKFASCEQSELVTKIDFTTGATAPQFIDNSNIDWADGETPHFYAYQHYWIIISDKTGFVKEIY